MKEQDEITARNLSEMETSNRPAGEFKAVIIKIVTRLEKRVEDLSETLSKEMEAIKKKKQKQSEVKNVINQIKNTPDKMNSRPEEVEEQIINLEHTVMESNQAEQVREKIMPNETQTWGTE